jgi:hypothetical protein
LGGAAALDGVGDCLEDFGERGDDEPAGGAGGKGEGLALDLDIVGDGLFDLGAAAPRDEVREGHTGAGGESQEILLCGEVVGKEC